MSSVLVCFLIVCVLEYSFFSHNKNPIPVKNPDWWRLAVSNRHNAKKSAHSEEVKELWCSFSLSFTYYGLQGKLFSIQSASLNRICGYLITGTDTRDLIRFIPMYWLATYCHLFFPIAIHNCCDLHLYGWRVHFYEIIVSCSLFKKWSLELKFCFFFPIFYFEFFVLSFAIVFFANGITSHFLPHSISF